MLFAKPHCTPGLNLFLMKRQGNTSFTIKPMIHLLKTYSFKLNNSIWETGRKTRGLISVIIMGICAFYLKDLNSQKGIKLGDYQLKYLLIFFRCRWTKGWKPISLISSMFTETYPKVLRVWKVRIRNSVAFPQCGFIGTCA